MNLANPNGFRSTITSYPILSNTPQRSINPEAGLRASNLDQKIDNFIASTFSNQRGAEQRKEVNSQNVNAYLPLYPVKKEKPDQDPLVRLRGLRCENNNYQTLGMRLPEISQFERKKKSEERNIRQKEQKSQRKKSRICPIIGWIIGGLLIAALITFLVLFIACKIDKNRQYHERIDESIKDKQVSSIPASEQPCIINKEQYKDSIEAIDVYQRQQPIIINTITRKSTSAYLPQNITPKQLFYKMDHTNYPFVHLRHNTK